MIGQATFPKLRYSQRQPLMPQAIAVPKFACHRRLCLLAFLMLMGLVVLPGYGQSPAPIRVATFNVSLYGERPGEVLKRLRTGSDRQAQHLAEIIQRVRPEIILLNEIDYDPAGEVLSVFHDKYLAVGQHASNSPDGPARPIDFPHRFAAPVNTGKHSGFDLSGDGVVDSTPGTDGYAADCWGFGRYAGQYGMAILSKHRIDRDAVRTFQNFLWKDMPEARLPDNPETPAANDWYSAEATAQFPLSSKSHWDVPILIDGKRVHLLASHPTPPVFDGSEDRNGRRNHDENRFWADYVGMAGEGGEAITRSDTQREPYIYDDAGKEAHLAPNESFIILGDLNSDPEDGDGPEGIRQLLASPRPLKYPPPSSEGAAEQSRLQGGANTRHRGNPRQDTSDPADDPGPGNLRIDYVLPSAELSVRGSGVFWPAANDPLFPLVGVHPFPSSDHRLVWVDLVVSGQQSAVSDQPEPGEPGPADR